MSEFQEATSVAFQTATIQRIRKLRKEGFQLADDATYLDCWRVRQILLRRELGIADDASYDEVVKATIQRFPLDPDYRDELEFPLEELQEPVAAKCSPGDRLILIREPDHPIWMQAIRVCCQNGQTVGYVPQWLCGDGRGAGTDMAAQMDRGRPADAHVARIHVNRRKRGPNLALYATIRVWR